MFRDAALVAGKDLRVELALAGSPRTRSRRSPSWCWCCSPSPSTPTAACSPGPRAGLFWVAVLFCALLAVQRAFAVEAADGNRDALRLSGLDPAGIFLGKAGGRRRPAPRLEVVLGVGVVVLYGTDARTAWRCCSSPCVAATVGLAAAGTPLRRARRRPAGARDPAAAPAPARSSPRCSSPPPGPSRPPSPDVPATAGRGCGLLAVFAAVYIVFGAPRLRLPAGGVVTAAAPTGSRAPGSSGVATARRRSPPCSLLRASCSAPPTQDQGDAVRLMYIHVPDRRWSPTSRSPSPTLGVDRATCGSGRSGGTSWPARRPRSACVFTALTWSPA